MFNHSRSCARTIRPDKMNNYSSYLLLDTALIDGAHPVHSLKAKRSVKWLKPLYDRSALSVSPVIIDIAEAIRSNRVDLMMSAANSVLYNLGASLIDTDLELEGVVAHLRNFIYFEDQDGVEFTLRLADCAVLAALSQTLSSDQWSELAGPFARWRIHDREGKLNDLPQAVASASSRTPLILTNEQVSKLLAAAEPDRLLANLQAMRPTILNGWSSADAHRIASEVTEVWTRSENKDHSTLLLFARAVFESGAKLLRQNDTVDYLKGPDQAAIRLKIQHQLEQFYSGC